MWQIILAVCGGISAIAVAGTYAFKIIHGIYIKAKSPWERVHSRLDEMGENQRGIFERLGNIEAKQKDGDQITARLELLNLVYHQPGAVVTINDLYDKYVEKGYNSYVHGEVETWRKESPQ